MVLQHPVPDKLLLLIGDVTVSFAMLELELKSTVWALLGSDQRTGQIVTAEIPFKGIRALTANLYLHRHGEDSDFQQLAELLKRAANIESKRNQITHSIWGIGDGPLEVTRMKETARELRGFNFQVEKFTEEDFSIFVNQIKRLAHEVLEFQTKLILSGKGSCKP